MQINCRKGPPPHLMPQATVYGVVFQVSPSTTFPSGRVILMGLLSFSARSAKRVSCSAFSLLYMARRSSIYWGGGLSCGVAERVPPPLTGLICLACNLRTNEKQRPKEKKMFHSTWENPNQNLPQCSQQKSQSNSVSFGCSFSHRAQGRR